MINLLVYVSISDIFQKRRRTGTHPIRGHMVQPRVLVPIAVYSWCCLRRHCVYSLCCMQPSMHSRFSCSSRSTAERSSVTMSRSIVGLVLAFRLHAITGVLGYMSPSGELYTLTTGIC